MVATLACRHAHLNNIVLHSLSRAAFPSVLEPVRLDRGDGRQPDRLTVFPFHEGKCLTLDVTCVDAFTYTVLVQLALAGLVLQLARREKKRKWQR